MHFLCVCVCVYVCVCVCVCICVYVIPLSDLWSPCHWVQNHNPVRAIIEVVLFFMFLKDGYYIVQ